MGYLGLLTPHDAPSPASPAATQGCCCQEKISRCSRHLDKSSCLMGDWTENPDEPTLRKTWYDCHAHTLFSYVKDILRMKSNPISLILVDLSPVRISMWVFLGGNRQTIQNLDRKTLSQPDQFSRCNGVGDGFQSPWSACLKYSDENWQKSIAPPSIRVQD